MSRFAKNSLFLHLIELCKRIDRERKQDGNYRVEKAKISIMGRALGKFVRVKDLLSVHEVFRSGGSDAVATPTALQLQLSQ